MDEDEKIEFVKHFLNGLKSVVCHSDTFLRSGLIKQGKSKIKSIENTNVSEEHKKILIQSLRQQIDASVDTSEVLSRLVLRQVDTFGKDYIESIRSGSLDLDFENEDKIDLDIESLTLSITKKFEKE